MNTTHTKEPTEQKEKLKVGQLLKTIDLRDYFAAKALPGLMARNWSNHKGTDEELIGVWARSSYAVADAMLRAREAA